jgi:hypothetical protein
MSKQVLILIAAVLFLSAGEVQAAPTSVSWDGGGDGHSWADANNWDPNIVPDNNAFRTFAVTIDSNSIGVDKIEVSLQQRRDINSLDCYGSVHLESGMWYLPDLNISSGLTNHGNLELDLDIKGDVINTGGAYLDMWEHLNIYGNIYNNPNAIIDVSYRDIDVEDTNVINEGTIIAFANGSLGETNLYENRGNIQLYGGGGNSTHIFDNNSTGQIEGWGLIVGEQQVKNQGTIYASFGILLIYSDISIINNGTLGNKPLATLHLKAANSINNQGTIVVNPGGGVAFDCNLINDTNGVIELRGGTLAAMSITQSADANFAGFGTITGDVTIDPNGLIELTGPTNIIGDVNIPDRATLKLSDGQTLITGHTTCDGTIHLVGGTVIFQGGCDCDGCNIISEAGTDRNHFDINADGIEDFKDFASFANTWLWQASWR